MTSPTVELQTSASAALLAYAGVLAIVGQSSEFGPAVFAPGQPYDAVYPRITIHPPQRINRASSCGVAADLILTLHSWAEGPDCTLRAGALADAAIEALRPRLVLSGWRIISFGLEASRPVGDPEPSIEHFVTDFRFSVRQAV